jgi:primosomal protein N' (replication factor Y) (superfamily II helicase)
MDQTTLFADVLLPLPLPGYFTYRVPAAISHQMKIGIRVVVPFGPRKIYSALVRRIHHTPPSVQAKYILSAIDESPVVFEKQFEFWEWIADYYLSTAGEVMNVALPPTLKLASETKITLSPDFDGEASSLNDKEFLIAEALEIQKNLTISEVSKITGLQKVFPLIGGMMEKGVVLLQEELENPYRAKIEKFVSLSTEFQSEEKLKQAFDYAETKAPRQLEVLIALIKLSGRYQQNIPREVTVKEINALVKNASSGITALEQKGILSVYKKKVSRFAHLQQTSGHTVFNDHQQKAIDEIRNLWQEKDIVLLHGVTSSGKTEIYIQLIQETLDKGMQVLYLLPEIALTTQIIIRIQQHFGDKAGVYHSRFNEMERTEVWNNLALGGIESLNKKISYQLVVGPRSALFLPFQNLGLIIVDEEHESSYKQHDPAPRYHARDAATWLARSFGAKVLLGSATPSVETYYHAQSGRYGLVELLKRYGGMQMPEILVADIKKDTREKKMKSHLSPLLFNNIQEALDNGRQVILFQNRRGFSPRMECEQCNWMPVCTQCDVSLVYHKMINKLKCHYCGYTITPQSRCPSCASTEIKLKGFGTEKVEEELPLLFPAAKVKRMDLDTTRAKNAYQNIIHDFEDKKIDILIGTQMVSKGLDFENVGVVGILNADNMLGFPDFRAHERAFQMMAQVSGRAGRKNTRGIVVIQSFDPYHAIIRQVIDNDYTEMYKNQILERRNFHYPPFYRLVTLTLIHRDPDLVNKAADFLCVLLKKYFSQQDILGPEYPLVARIKSMYLKNIIVKFDRKSNLQKNKEQLKALIDQFGEAQKWKQVKIRLNVDPA